MGRVKVAEWACQLRPLLSISGRKKIDIRREFNYFPAVPRVGLNSHGPAFLRLAKIQSTARVFALDRSSKEFDSKRGLVTLYGSHERRFSPGRGAMSTRKAPHLILLLACTVSLIVLSTSGNTRAQQRSTAKTVQIINVGITEYAKLQRTQQNFERLFRELAASADASEPVTFRFAVGTYGEVRDWYNKGLIDVAVLSAMPIGDLLLAGDSANLNEAYLGDLSVSPPTVTASPPGAGASAPRVEKSVLSLFSDREPDPFYYRAGCIFLREDKVLEAIANSSDPMSGLKNLWEQGKLRFLFVRPYSLSGYIAPVSVLKQAGIDPLKRDGQMEFTYQHKESLNQLIEPDPSKPWIQHQVAFVLDDSRYDKGDANVEQMFGRIRMPLDDYLIPREVVLANYHQERIEVNGSENRFTRTRALMGRLFRNWVTRVETGRFRDSAGPGAALLRFRSRANWQRDYDKVKNLLTESSLPKELLYKSTLDDLLDDLIKTPRSRLALVLSGGGAKCAYQAGAIVEIEKQLQAKLTKERQALQKQSTGSDPTLSKKLEDLSQKLDINLVVGTSGGAINALLVAMGVTKDPKAAAEIGSAWKAFKQEQFLRPSFGLRVLFGFCFSVLQALLITVTVLLFGRQAMNWPATIAVLAIIGGLQLIPAFYFRLSKTSIFRLLVVEVFVLLVVILLVIVSGWVIELVEKLFFRKSPKATHASEHDPHHWRKLTILLLIFFGVLETAVAIIPGFVDFGERLPVSHWWEHAWTALILLCSWSYPFPLLIALLMLILGWQTIPLLKRFNWLNWRGRFVAWTSIVLVIVSVLLTVELLFRANSPSEAEGIEAAFSDNVPKLIKATVDPNFGYTPSNDDHNIESLSRQIIAGQLLKRDLIITSSKLPAQETTEPLAVNSLPDDLYFYYRHNQQDDLKPPRDKKFVPIKYNQGKLIDIVIGSSTIYPIFPSRTLGEIYTGNEEFQSPKSVEMRIIDGGFIHNIPIEAAQLWGATHIIVIEASPTRQQIDPNVFWDHIVTAFGYLFSQAQRTDVVGPAAEAYVMRPTSKCEKLNIKAVCTEKDGEPEPNMDTFDFSRRAADRAFLQGSADVKSRTPLFVRTTGAPRFQEVLPRPAP